MQSIFFQDASGCVIVLPEAAVVACSHGLAGNVTAVPLVRLDAPSVHEDTAALIHAVGVPKILRATTFVIVEPETLTDAGKFLTTAAVLTAVSVGACVIGVSAAALREQIAAVQNPDETTVEDVLCFVENERRRKWLSGSQFGEVLRARDFGMANIAGFGLNELLKTIAGATLNYAQAA